MPIRRHPALVSLSREHHLALQLARAVQTGVSRTLEATLPSDPGARIEHVRSFFARELAPHFAAEEEVLLDAVHGRDAKLDALCASIRDEHGEMRGIVDALVSRIEARDGAQDAREIASQLDRFGALLEAHVRREERELYPAIEATLGEAALTSLAERLEGFHRKEPAQPAT